MEDPLYLSCLEQIRTGADLAVQFYLGHAGPYGAFYRNYQIHFLRQFQHEIIPSHDWVQTTLFLLEHTSGALDLVTPEGVPMPGWKVLALAGGLGSLAFAYGFVFGSGPGAEEMARVLVRFRT